MTENLKKQNTHSNNKFQLPCVILTSAAASQHHSLASVTKTQALSPTPEADLSLVLLAHFDPLPQWALIRRLELNTLATTSSSVP